MRDGRSATLLIRVSIIDPSYFHSVPKISSEQDVSRHHDHCKIIIANTCGVYLQPNIMRSGEGIRAANDVPPRRVSILTLCRVVDRSRQCRSALARIEHRPARAAEDSSPAY